MKIFHANWTEHNRHLQLPKSSFSKELAWNLFSIACLPLGLARAAGWGIGFLARKIVLPAAWIHTPEQLQQADGDFLRWASQQSDYKLQERQVRTPDGAKLRAYHFQHAKSDEKTPTILLFHPNAEFATRGSYLWLLHQFASRSIPCNFILFDYRGVNHSEGFATSGSELILDSEAMVQFALEELSVPPSQLHFYGWSLGGCLAANAMALHPECTGKIVLERTFADLGELAMKFLPKPIFFWIPSALRSQNWRLETTGPASTLKGRILLVYHPKDRVIPEPYSLFSALKKTRESLDVIKLPSDKPLNHHCAPLESYWIRRNGAATPAHRAVVDFLLQ